MSAAAPFQRLVYYSRNEVDGDADALDAAIDEILSLSQRNNAQADVTGALLFNTGCFGQVLEGPRRAVEATFERIQRDPRHSDVTLLAFETTDARAFPNWSMAYVGAKPAQAVRYNEIAASSGFDPSRMTANRLLETLHGLAMEKEA
ncbi:BLUF domain-containing protein [Tianweitania sp. BSSL-BM11]|uniref:BLUF domain-containing protein n=1 Tax=Tianweitania aestuarii TaxID=2814886 RepID=A0ABS5RQ77_9HYPH|nr:BLUF domain-containing protein [Tianweitania aestuarii]MBS9719193.1 BLUF domain-containing protein [Tianweitania aestuarii]